MQITNSAVGRKLLMAITGQLMVLFVIVHMLGNSSIFLGADGINAYAKHLHDLPPLVWAFRISMLAFILVHAWFGIQVSVENSAATPKKYSVQKHLRATLSSKSMIWTGVIIALFVIYHLLHFTVHATPGVVTGVDAQGRFDVYTMVVNAFQSGLVPVIYIAAMIAVFLHLSHGVGSFFQTLGWNNANTLPKISNTSRGFSFVLLLGYIAIPVVILAGILK